MNPSELMSVLLSDHSADCELYCGVEDVRPRGTSMEDDGAGSSDSLTAPAYAPGASVEGDGGVLCASLFANAYAAAIQNSYDLRTFMIFYKHEVKRRRASTEAT